MIWIKILLAFLAGYLFKSAYADQAAFDKVKRNEVAHSARMWAVEKDIIALLMIASTWLF